MTKCAFCSLAFDKARDTVRHQQAAHSLEIHARNRRDFGMPFEKFKISWGWREATSDMRGDGHLYTRHPGWFLTKSTDVQKQYNYSVEDVLKILSNLGHDTNCGACMEIAFSGVTFAQHNCDSVAKTAERTVLRERDTVEKVLPPDRKVPGPSRVRFNFGMVELVRPGEERSTDYVRADLVPSPAAAETAEWTAAPAICPACQSPKQERIAGLWLCNACGHEWNDPVPASASPALREQIEALRGMPNEWLVGLTDREQKLCIVARDTAISEVLTLLSAAPAQGARTEQP